MNAASVGLILASVFRMTLDVYRWETQAEGRGLNTREGDREGEQEGGARACPGLADLVGDWGTLIVPCAEHMGAADWLHTCGDGDPEEGK